MVNFSHDSPILRPRAGEYGKRLEFVARAWLYRRALALKKLAEIVVRDHDGELPQNREELERLPGIGRGTSGSLMAFAFNKPEIFIETNIRRVFIYFFFSRARKAVTDDAIERYIESTIDRKNPREWYWALMDYGAWLAKERPVAVNLNRKSAHYRKQSVFKGSDREARGRVLSYLLAQKKGSEPVSMVDIGKVVDIEKKRLEKAVSRLGAEGFIIKRGNSVRINQ